MERNLYGLEQFQTTVKGRFKLKLAIVVFCSSFECYMKQALFIHDTFMIHSGCDSVISLANIFQRPIEYELIYSLRGAKHRVDYSVHIQ